MNEKKLTGYPSIDKPWLKYYSDDVINAHIPECTMYEYIYNLNQANLDKIAISYYATDITYRKLFYNIGSVAGALEHMGVSYGDIVTVCMINSPETISLIFALNKIGAVANMVYGVSTPNEIRKYLADTKSTIVFTLDMFQDKFVEIANDMKIEKIIVVNSTYTASSGDSIGKRTTNGIKYKEIPKGGRFITWQEFLKDKKASTVTVHNPEEAAIITYTGGTTGGSKGVLLSNRGFVANIWQYCKTNIELSSDSKWMMVLPLFIAFGIFSMMIPLSVGMTMIVRMPMTDSIANLCKKFKPNHTIYGPAYWEALADDNEDLDLSYLIEPMSGGDVLNSNVANKINKYLESHGCPYKLMNGYGMSEVGPGISINRRQAYEAGSVGVPFAKNVVSAFDINTGEELKYDEEGEICVHSPSMMIRYINNPEETSNIIRKHNDGLLWVHSGDLGFISKNGFVHISGRLKRYFLHIANGVQKKVFSLDIEKMLLKHPKVDNCAVVPVTDSVSFQVPVAYVILKKENQEEKNIEHEFIAYGAAHFVSGYQPVRYIFVDKFPLTKVGKVNYLELEKMAENMPKQ